jgi:aminoglycoside phosphotransferase (APT) family kinase protein
MDIERLLAGAERAPWGFQNRTDFATLDGERVVVQRYRRRADAQHRLDTLRALAEPAAAASIPIPRVREAGLDADPPWIVFEALPGVPVPEAGATVALARAMGELLARFRALDVRGLDGLWAEPERLAAAAEDWSRPYPQARALIARVPELFAGRQPVLAHGDFAPVNVLTDGTRITGLVDFESARRADVLFDVAWWAWSVSFSGDLAQAWPAFRAAAAVAADEPRIHALQVLRMLELLAGDTLDDDVRALVAQRLRASVSGRSALP